MGCREGLVCREGWYIEGVGYREECSRERGMVTTRQRMVCKIVGVI